MGKKISGINRRKMLTRGLPKVNPKYTGRKWLDNTWLNFPWSQDPAAAAAKLLQSCPTVCDPIDGSPSGSPAPGILQARTLEGLAISFSNAWMWKVKRKSLSRVRLFATPWTAAYQAPPSMGFARQEYWSGVPLPSLHVSLLTSVVSKSLWLYGP